MVKQRFWYYFWLYSLIHVLVWIIVPATTRYNLPFDTIESIAWGEVWALGYDKHPFLAAWIARLWTWGFHTIDIPMYVLAQINVVLLFWSIWQLSKKLLTPQQALVAVFLLQGIWYYNLLTPKFNPTTLMPTLWGLTALALYYALTRSNIRYWIATGLLLGCTWLCKYQSILFIASVAIIILYYRPRITHFLYKLSILSASFFIILLPNLWWMFKHFNLPFQYVIERITQTNPKVPHHVTAHFWYPISFFCEQLAAASLMLMACYLIYRYVPRMIRTREHWFFVQALAWFPLAFTLLISATTGAYLYAKWGSPYLIFSGLFFMYYYQPHISDELLKKIFTWTIFMLLLIGIGRFIDLRWGPVLYHRATSDAYFPGRVIAHAIEERWHQHYHQRLPYVVGDHYLIANITAYAKDRPIPYFDGELALNPWIVESDLLKKGGVIAWKVQDFTKQRLAKQAKKFPNLLDLGVLSFPKHTKIKTEPVTIRVFFIPPAEK